jgi:hypothetical protein
VGQMVVRSIGSTGEVLVYYIRYISLRAVYPQYPWYTRTVKMAQNDRLVQEAVQVRITSPGPVGESGQ